ncbi:hypothetical protein ACWDOP_07505 [Nocardia sp. NPDC003693]
MTNYWGDAVPGWISAAGTVGTIIALGIGLKSLRADADEHKDNERSQARLITSEEVQRGHLEFKVTNQSSAPIVEVELEKVQMSTDPHAKFTAGQMTSPGRVGPYEPVRTLSAGQSFSVKIDLSRSDGSAYDYAEDLRGAVQFTCTIKFTDSRGLRWRRTDMQLPTRVYT